MTKKIKKTTLKKSSKKNVTKENKIELIPDPVEIELNADINEDEIDYVGAYEYNCAMSAHDDPEDGSWYFALELFTEDNRLIDIHSQHTFQTYQDALLDCYGIIEYLGFSITDKNELARVSVNHWNDAEDKYDEEIIFFDGYDFFKNKVETTKA
jgi:hypothetical protein